MLKDTQTIRRQITEELFECAGPFCGIYTWKVKFKLQWTLWHPYKGVQEI